MLLYSQGLDGAQGGKEAFADSLQLVIVQRQQVEVLQVLEGVDPQTVDFIGVQQPGRRRRTTTGSFEKKKSVFLQLGLITPASKTPAKTKRQLRGKSSLPFLRSVIRG